MPPINLALVPGYGFGVSYSRDSVPDSTQFKLHNHNDMYELVLFINGDAEFHAEGNVYKVKPYDMLITRPVELHRIVCVPQKPYERYVIYLSRDYFKNNHCEEFARIFDDRNLGEKNLIPADTVREALWETFSRLYKYASEKNYLVANAVLVEFLYLLNNAENPVSGAAARDKRITDVIKYINEHLNETLRLDELAERFYVDKYHLCRIFKRSTGYTLNRYINYKRLLLVRELHAQGQSLLEASTNAGFNNYSHFYRMYIRQNGEAPRNMR